MSEILLQRLSRVRTFIVGKWKYLNPRVFSPYGLASIGYSVTGQNTISCDICQHTVTIELQNELEQDQCLRQIYNHLQDCLYHNEQMHQILQEQIYLAIDDIYSAMEKQQSKHPHKNYPILHLPSLWTTLSTDPLTWKQVQLHYGLSTHSINVVFYLHFFGWVLTNEGVCCYFCGRSIAQKQMSWQPTSQQHQTQESSAEAFDVMEEHRYFCIWRKHWRLYLQYLYDKHEELVGYKSRALPLEAKKTRIEVDRYIELFQTRTKETFAKIILALEQCKNLNDKIINDREISCAGIEKNSQGYCQRIREQNQEIQFISHQFEQAFGSLKRIKLS